MLFKRLEDFSVANIYPHKYKDPEATFNVEKEGGYTFYDFLVFLFLGSFALMFCKSLIVGLKEKGYIIICFTIIGFCTLIGNL